MTDYETVVSKAEQVPHVVAATPFVYRQVLLSSPSGVQGIVLRGIDPEREQRVTDLGKNVRSGTLGDLRRPPAPSPPADAPSADAAPVPSAYPGIVLGKELALRLGVFVDDQVNVDSPVSQTTDLRSVMMTPKIRTFTVVATFESGMYEYDASFAYIDLPAAQQFFNMGQSVTGIEVKVDDIFSAGEIARNVEHAVGLSYSARDWMQLNRNLFSALKLEKIMMFLLLVLITIVASFNIVSTLTMIVTEKQREIAILKAMGATQRGIMRIFMLNGLIIGLAGTAVGIPLGYAFLWLIERYWTFDPTVYYISHIPVHVQALDVILVSLSAVAISFAATVYPSRQAAKMDPAAALRYQ
jgi:lipoprotein-releasing system permease protein